MILAGVWWVYRTHSVSTGLSPSVDSAVREEIGNDPVVEGMEARLYLNGLRERAGLVPFYRNEALEKAAAGHASYLASNRADGHYQNPSLPGFTGESPADRAVAAGYPSRVVRENLSSGNLDSKESVDGLFSAIYHRFGFLDPEMDEIGIAYARDRSGRRIYVYDMGSYRIAELCRQEGYRGRGEYLLGLCADGAMRVGRAKFTKVSQMNAKRSGKVIVWPYEGQKDVPPAFFEEIPDPLPGYSVSGYPISIVFNDFFFKRVSIGSFRLYDAGDKREIPVRLMGSHNDPHHLLEENQYAIFPLERLEYATRYIARVDYVADGRSGAKEWHFTTRRFDAPILRVTGSEAQFRIEPQKSYILYLQPHGPNDLPKELLHPRGVVVEQIDPNTFRIEISGGTDTPVTIVAGGRKIRLEVASAR